MAAVSQMSWKFLQKKHSPFKNCGVDGTIDALSFASNHPGKKIP